MRRDPGLDAARALATLGVLFGHAAVSYLATPIGWAVRDTSSARAVDLLVWTARQFLMPTFFLLSGWLGARTLERVGAAALIRHRARRLVLPLVVFLVPMSLAMNGLWDWGKAVGPRPLWDWLQGLPAHVAVAAPVPKLRGSRLPVTLGHLWYLYYLIALTGLGVAGSALWRRAPAGWRAGCSRAVHAIDRAGLTAPLLAVPTAAMLAIGGKLQLDTPLDFALDPLILVYFGGFFAWGWWLGAGDRGQAAATPPRVRAPIELMVAAATIAALVPALIASVGGAAPAAAALYGSALSSWLLAAALVDACRRWQRPPAVLGAMAIASFWTYLVHLPLAVLLQIGASRLYAPGPLEYLAIAALALGVSLASFALIRRTWLGRLVA